MLLGVGKTTTILCLARQLLGPSFKEAVLELNASNERGIDVVRNRIKMFAQQKVTLPRGRHKIVILDEADAMTEAAQQALRRTMEIYSNTTRFALAANSSEKIIEPIQSRCAMLRYSRLDNAQVLAKLLEVCEKENVSYTEDGMEAIIFTAQGDMRQALNNLQVRNAYFTNTFSFLISFAISLQSTHEGFDHVNSENVFKVCDEPHPLLIKDMLTHCSKGDMDPAYKIARHLWNLGYSAEDIITNVFRVCKTHNELPEYLKLEFIKQIGYTHLLIAQGTRSLLQLSAMLARLCQLVEPSSSS